MASYIASPPNAIDDLPGVRCAHAMGLLALLRHWPHTLPVAPGSISYRAATDLAACGMARLIRCADEPGWPVMYRVTLVRGGAR